MMGSRVVLLVVSLFLAAGCGKDDGRLEVSGTVKFKGEPIKDGANVRLVAVEPADNGEASAQTAGGGFTVPKASGLKPGKYLVQFSLGDGKTAVNPVDPNAPPGPGGGTNIISKELIPLKWGTQSKETVTVTKEGPNKFDFVID
jgi:hypothetical protein